ncbi:hypothetical protein PYCCODRAFT_1463354 [Trametes coccinea BRFM310]|uniref:BTB domain-containing protein n=1 Tax=Trametes coccinea (strain BRFM310) TaxID=1353009 RepID=A0A1Y2J442_TRAC3|nr:hypothetical protein PYCCODRAFT_1463354 [Trametes coccinea BRFM310]
MSDAEETLRSLVSVEEGPALAAQEVVHDPDFFYELVYIRVQHSLFAIPRRYLEDNSDTFRALFTVRKVDGVVEGMAEDNPLELHGIDANDFREFLCALTSRLVEYDDPQYYALADSSDRRVSTPDSQQPNCWKAVYIVSAKWQFEELSSLSLQYLRRGSPITRIELAHSLDLHGWLQPAVWELSHRRESLKYSEYKALGVDFAVNMAKLRLWVIRADPPLDRSAYHKMWYEGVELCFGSDYAEKLRQDEEAYMTASP